MLTLYPKSIHLGTTLGAEQSSLSFLFFFFFLSLALFFYFHYTSASVPGSGLDQELLAWRRDVTG